MLVLLVTLLFLIESPVIVIPALTYFLSRHLIDAYNLLTVFRQELNSSLTLVSSVLSHHIYALYLFLVYSLGLLMNRHNQGVSDLATWLSLLLTGVSVYLHHVFLS